MTYFAPIETSIATRLEFPGTELQSSEQAAFTPLEWSIVRLARDEELWTISAKSPVRRWLNWMLGRKAYRLANDRLEALRTMAIRSWNFGFTVAADEIAAFLEAGFSARHYALLVDSITASSGPAAIGGDVLI